MKGEILLLIGRSNKRKLMSYLKQDEDSYRHIFESSPDILLFVIDLKGEIVMVRGGNDHLFSGEAELNVGEKYRNLIYEEDLKKVEGYFEKVFSGDSQYVEYRTIGLSGEINDIEVTLVPIEIENNEVIGLYGLTNNITEKKELKRGFQEREEQLQSLHYYSYEVISILDSEGTIIFESPSIETALGYNQEENTGKSFLSLVHSDDYQLVKSRFQELLNRPNTPFTLEIRLKHKNGEWRNYEAICTNHLETPSVNGIICNLHDITELKKQQLEIQYMAYHDYLTELPNRRAFEERLDLEIRLANVDERKFGVLFLNLDGFKFINDSLGRDIGDLLLTEIARKIKNELSNYIEMIARTDGDEFAILTTKVQGASSMEQIAREVLQLFAQPFDIKDYSLFVTSSIGISVYPESGKESSSLMKNADLALYLAEKSGSNNFKIYSPTANIGTYKIFSLKNDLNQALRNNQFLLYYQPIIHTGTKQIVSVEALIRWDHPDWGTILPGEFIPLAEESGLIIQLGEWVLQTVCKNLRLWHKAGYFIKASVNLSVIQFLQADLLEMIESTLQKNDLDPKWINIEITETAMIEQEVKVLEKVRKMREMGIQISLDDFGTGYASFKKLIDLKPDILKLDRSIIKGITEDKDSIEITKSIIQLAHKLSIEVVAEGVETEEQHEFLSKLECDWVQGYLFSRPVPVENIEKLLLGQWTSQNEPQPLKDRRKYFRIEFVYPLEAYMTVSELNGKKVELGNTKVLFENIGPGGLRFLSNIKLPAQTDIILKFQVKVVDEELTHYGTIMHDSEQDDIYRYGVKFIVDEAQREYLIKHFNQLQLQLKRNPLLPGHPFVTENIQSYFKKL